MGERTKVVTVQGGRGIKKGERKSVDQYYELEKSVIEHLSNGRDIESDLVKLLVDLLEGRRT